MNPNQHPHRHIANQEFQESLEQLEDILQDGSSEDEAAPTSNHSVTSEVELGEDLTNIDLAALEDAVADIEEYLEKRTK